MFSATSIEREIEPDVRPGESHRVIMLIHDLRPGGAERVFLRYVNQTDEVETVPVLVRPILDWADRLRPEGPLLDLAQGGDALLLDSREKSRGASEDGPNLPSFILPGVRAAALLRKARRLARLARALDARVASTFLHKSHIIATTAKLLFHPGLRVVVNVHEQMSDHLVHHHPPMDRVLYGSFVRRLFPYADRVVAVSRGVKDDLVRNFSLSSEKVSVLRNPIDVRQIREVAREDVGPLRLDTSDPVLVAVGRMVHLKGFDLLLQALARLPADCTPHTILVGDGEEREALESLSRDLGLRDSVTFTGFRENPWPVMRRADLFVLPSRTEASPNVLGEALALGLPVVATRCSPGVTEFLEPGPAGLLAAPEDVEDLAAKIHEVLTDDQLRQHLRLGARRTARSLQARSSTEAYGQMLRSVLEGGEESESVQGAPPSGLGRRQP